MQRGRVGISALFVVSLCLIFGGGGGNGFVNALKHSHMEPSPSSEAAFKVFVSSSGMDYVKRAVALPLFEDMKKSFIGTNLALRVPAEQRTTTISKLGLNLSTFSLTSVVLNTFNFDAANSGIDLSKGNGFVDLDLSKLSISITAIGTWNSKPVQLTANVDGASVDASVKMGAANGYPTAVITGATLSLTPEMVKITVDSGVGDILGWALNNIISWCRPLMVKIVADQFQQHYGEPNSQIAKILSTLPLTKVIKPADVPSFPLPVEVGGGSVGLRKDLVTRISLYNAPTTSPAGLGLAFDAHVYLQGETQCDPSCTRRATPTPSAQGSFLEVQISDFLPCCAITAVYKMGMLNFKGVVTPPKIDLPPDVTDGLSPLVNTILEKWELSYALTFKNVPQVRFTPGKVSVSIQNTNLIMFYRDRDGTAGPMKAMDATVSVQLGAAVSVAGSHLSYSLSNLQVSLNGFECFIPEVTDFIKSEAQNLIDIIIVDKVLPMVNKILSVGFDLPTVAGLSVVNPTITIGDGYISIRSSFSFVKPAGGFPGLDLLIEENAFLNHAHQHFLPNPITQADALSRPAIPLGSSLPYEVTHPSVRMVSPNEGDYASYIDLDLQIPEDVANAVAHSVATAVPQDVWDQLGLHSVDLLNQVFDGSMDEENHEE